METYNAAEQIYAATEEIAHSKTCSQGRGHFEWSLSDMVFVFIPTGCQGLTGDVVYFGTSRLPAIATAARKIKATVAEINEYYANY